MNPHDVRVFGTPQEFRAWLEAHHGSATELWVGYYKKGVPKTAMSYKEAVDEALCFGWIDGQGRRIDDELTANRFSPRTKRSNWSVINVARMKELITEGRAHPAGIRAFEARTGEGTGSYSYEKQPAELPPAYLARFQANAAAWSWWQAQRPSYQRIAIQWVVSAKQEATRERRLVTLIEDCAAGRLIKSQRYGRAGDTQT